MSELMSKATADRQFEAGDDCATCKSCPRSETYAGEFRECVRCHEPFCPDCCYDDQPESCAQCFDRLIERIASWEFNR